MIVKPIRAYFEDEAPRIGSGWRTVHLKVGRKWIYVIDPYNGNRAKLPKAKAEFLLQALDNDRG